MTTNQLVQILKENGFTAEIHQFDHYEFVKISGKNIMGGYCTAHDKNETYSSKQEINGRISVDHVDCFDKWYKCPVSLPLPKDEHEVEFLMKQLEFWGSNEGYHKSVDYEFDCTRTYHDTKENLWDSKCSSCNVNEVSPGEHFCTQCEKEGYHHCENCEKVIKESRYDESVGGVVCMECAEHSSYDDSSEEVEYRQIQEEQEMIARAEKETFQQLNGFSDEENELLKWKLGKDIF